MISLPPFKTIVKLLSCSLPYEWNLNIAKNPKAMAATVLFVVGVLGFRYFGEGLMDEEEGDPGVRFWGHTSSNSFFHRFEHLGL